MKVKRFSTTRNKELRETDNESFIDENGAMNAPFAKMPIQDLAMISNFSVDVMKRYYTGDIKDVDYSIVEILMDGLSTITVRHRVSSFENALFIQMKCSPHEFKLDNKDYIPLELAAHILNISTEKINSIADEENKLFKDENDCLFIETQLVLNAYRVHLNEIGAHGKMYLKMIGRGEISIIIERELE